MKLTNIAKTVSVGAVAAAMAVSMTACGGSSSDHRYLHAEQRQLPGRHCLVLQ